MTRLLRVVSGPITAHVQVGRHQVPTASLVVAMAAPHGVIGVSLLLRRQAPVGTVHPRLQAEYAARASECIEQAWFNVLMEHGWTLRTMLPQAEIEDPTLEWWPWPLAYGGVVDTLRLIRQSPFMHSVAALCAEGVPNDAARFLATLQA